MIPNLVYFGLNYLCCRQCPGVHKLILKCKSISDHNRTFDTRQQTIANNCIH